MNDRDLTDPLARLCTAHESEQLLALCRELLMQRAVFGGPQPDTWRALSALVQEIDARTESP